MSPKNYNQEPEAEPDVTVDIPHERHQTPPAPTTAPPLPQLEPLPVRPINITDNAPTPSPAAPVVPPVPVPLHEFHEHKERRWPVILMYTSLAFLVALLVVFTGRWIYRKTTHPAKPANPVTTNQGSTPAAPSTTNNSTSDTSKNQTVQTTPTSQLPNNGPGDVVAIFVGTALVVGGLHFLYSLRKQS